MIPRIANIRRHREWDQAKSQNYGVDIGNCLEAEEGVAVFQLGAEEAGENESGQGQ